MDFFKTIAEHLKDGQQLTLTIKKSGENLIASILPDTSNVKDKSVSNIAPLIMSGTPEDFEAEFEKAIAPLDKTLGLISDISSYEEEVDKARSKSEMESKKKAAAEKQKKQYLDLLTLAKKNIDAKKYKDAKTVLEKAAALSVADKKEIEKMFADIESKSGAGSLFGAGEDNSDGKDIDVAVNQSEGEDNQSENEDNEE